MWKFNHHLKTVEYEVLTTKVCYGGRVSGYWPTFADVNGAAQVFICPAITSFSSYYYKSKNEELLRAQILGLFRTEYYLYSFSLLQIYLFDTLVFKY